MLDDLWITVRQLRQAPGHIAAVILALATGLAVCVAVFSTMQTVLFGEVPGVSRRADLVHVRWRNNNAPLSTVEWDRAVQLFGDPFTSLAAEGTQRMAVGLPTGPVTLTTSLVSGRYFETLGTRPVLGRLLDPTDAVDGGPLVVLLGAQVWREHFGGSPEAIGTTIIVAGVPAVVVGVTPDRMAGLTLQDSTSDADRPQLWLPLRTGPLQLAGRPQRWLSVAGRLRPGVALSTARADTARVGRLLEAERLTLNPATNQALRAFRAGFDWHDTPLDALTVTALLLFVPVGVLAIGCLNVLNLQLSRAADRVRELRLRLALGASRARIVRLLATEVVVLFAVAATVGWRGAVALLSIAEPYVGRRLAISAPVLWFGVALTFLVIAVAGVTPAWLAARGLSPGHGLERSHEAVRFKALRAGLVVAQVTASMALLFLSAVGLASLRAQAPALPRAADEVVIAEFALRDVHYSRAQAGVFGQRVMESLGGETPPATAGFSDVLPFTGAVRYALPGDAPDVARIVTGGCVTPGWFAAIDLRFVAGRPFGSGDSTAVAVVNQSAAAAIAGTGGAALGRVVRAAHADGALREVQIVGVVADSVTLGGEPVAMMFLPMPSEPPHELFLSARGPQVAVVAGQIRRALDAVDRAVPWVRIDTLGARQRSVFQSYRQVVWLGTALGTLSVGLAASGLFALMSYTVRRRTQEFGVRLAIGAAPRDLAQLIIRQGLTLIGLGVFGGFLIAIPLGFVLRSVLVGTSPVDPVVVSTVTAVFLIVGVVAAAAPAVRAARVDPMVALRQE